MKFNRIFQLAALFTAVIIALAFLPRLMHADEPAQADITAAWDLVRQSGAYEFSSDLRQVLTPLPTAINAGRQASETAVHISGKTDLNADSLHMTLWSNGGSVTTPETGVEFKLENGRSYARKAGGPWQPADDISGSFAPGGDMLAYLQAAENVVRHEPQLRRTPSGNLLITRYTFDVNGYRFALHMKNQLQQQDGLPPGMAVELPKVYADMTGTGELWIGSDGLPLRQRFDLHFPNRDDTSTRMDVTVNFSNFAPIPASSTISALGSSLEGTLTRAFTPRGFLPVPATLAILLFVALLIRRRQTKRLYNVVALSIVITLLFSPLLSSVHVAAYGTEQIAKQISREKKQEEQETQEELLDKLLTPSFDPHTDQLQQARLRQAKIDELQTIQQVQPAAPGRLLQEVTSSTGDDSKYFDSSCETDPNSDMDGDGLTNLEECLVGTLPGTSDTDGDLLNDGLEVKGAVIVNPDTTSKTWYSDPLIQDTNLDGLGDGREWLNDQDGDGVPDDTDGDGTPDFWDLDNDGDGVPDDKDLSPYSSTQDLTPYDGQNPMQLTIDNLTSGQLVKVEFQITPTNADHLWYTNNVLDWPDNDLQGQIQDSDGATFYSLDNTLDPNPNDNGDMRLIPMLEIEITGDNDNLPSQDILNQFGISVVQSSSDTQTAYVPAQLVTDSRGNKNVAFYGSMFYRAGDTWGNAQSVRLVWLVQALVDQCAEYTNNICTTYDVLNQEEIIQSYDEAWHLVGMHVSEEHGTTMDIIYEDPVATEALQSGYDKPYYMDTLYGLLYGLDYSFLAGRDCDNVDSTGACVGDGQLDITTGEITRRFNHETNSGVSEEERWGLPNVLDVVQNDYEAFDLASYDTSVTQTVKILDDQFTSAWSAAEPITPTLMFAYQEQYRSLNMDQGYAGSPNFDLTGSSVNLDLPLTGANAVSLNTKASVKWTPYTYDPIDGWDTADLQEFYDELTANLGSSFADVTDPEEAETYQTMAQQLYVTAYDGEDNIIEIDDENIDQDYRETDANIYFSTATKAGTVIRSVTSSYFIYTPTLQKIAAQLRAEGAEASAFSKNTLSQFVAQKWAEYTSDSVGIAKITAVGIFAVLALVGIFILYVLQDTSQAVRIFTAVSVAGFLLLYSILKPIMSFISFVSKATTFEEGVLALFADAEAISRSGIAAAVGLIISALIAIGIFIYVWAEGKASPGTIAFNELIAYTIASIIVAMIIFVLSVSAIGSILVSIIAAIDLILFFLGFKWSITGWLTGVIASAIYSYRNIVKYDVEAGDLSTDLTDPAIGITAGNSMAYSLPVTATITGTNTFQTREFWSNSLDYKLSLDKGRFETSKGARADDWNPYAYPNALVGVINDSAILTETLRAGVNIPASLWLDTAYALRGQSCWWTFCTEKYINGSSSENLGAIIIFDVLPATVEEFVATAWSGGQVRFLDKDGDGLLPSYEGGIDPDENNWDADGDNLSDSYELTISGRTAAEGGMPLDPLNADTDGDSLRDDLELLYGTNSGLADTDDDGIDDILEVGPDGGWFMAYSPQNFTRVWSSPRAPDLDSDGMSDLFERTQDTCPGCNPWEDPANPLIFSPNVWNESPVALFVDDDTDDGFVSPGASLVYTTTTSNNLSGNQDLAGELSLDPSAAFSGAPLAAQVDIASGGSESLVSSLAASTAGSGAHVLTSQMDLTDVAITSWSWLELQSDTANVQKGNAIKPAIVPPPGWSQPYLIALHEKQNNVSFITTHTASAEGTLSASGESYQSTDSLTAPAIACTDSGICFVVWGERLGGGTNGILSLQYHGGLANPGSGLLWAANNTSVGTPAIASNGTDFMLAFTAQSGGQTQVLVEIVGSGGNPTGSPLELTSSSGDIGDVTLTWTGNRYLAVWREGASLYRAHISSNGQAGDKTLIGPGTGWTATDGAESAPDLVFDALSRQSLLLFRAEVSGKVQLHGQRLDANGESAAIVLATDSALSQDGVNTAVCADPKNGGWVVAWALPGQNQVNYQALSQDGSLRGTTQLASGGGSQGIALACTWPVPTAEFDFNEDAGATIFADSSGSGYAFTCQGNQCPTAGVSGRFGSAIQFDGVDDTVVSNFPQNNSKFTSEIWFRTSDQTATIFTRESGYKRMYLKSGALCASTKTLVSGQSTVNEICASDINYSDDVWHHAVHVGSGSAHTLYVDGVLQGTNSITFESCSSCTGFTLTFDSSYSGLIDRLRFYNRALTGLEISDAFSAAMAIYDLDEIEGATTTVNATGNGFDGECSGASCPTFGVPGVAYTAAQFDGTNDYLTVNPAKKVDATYTYDFESSVGSEWSSTRTAPATREGEQTTFLGTFLNETVTLSLQDLPPHDTIEVAFDLYVLGAWAGNSTVDGPDNWEWGHDATPVLNTNFSNHSVGSAGSYQLYPAQSWNFSGIKLYGNENCDKNELIVTKDIPHLGDTTIGNNNVNCYKRPTDTVAVLYKDGNYSGNSWIVDPGRGLFPDIPKNVMSSVRVWANANAPKQGALGDTLEVGGFGTTTSIYRIKATIEKHTDSTISIYFKGLNPSASQNQWALDNVTVSALSDSSSLPLTDSSFTIAAWAQYTGQGSDSMILSQGSAQGSKGLQFGYRASNQFVCGFWIGDLVTTESYPSSNWQHWACTYEYYPSLKRTIYRNGVQVAQDISTGYEGFGPTYIGQLFGDLRRFEGTIDEIGVWQRALSAAEIAELYDKVKIENASVIEALSPVTSGSSQITLNNMALHETSTVLGSDSQTVTRTLTIDADAPVASVQVPANGDIIRGQGRPTLQASGSASDATSSVAAVQVKVDGGPWQAAKGTQSWHYTVDLDAMNEGTHTLSVRAVDLLGRTGSTTSVQFTLDRTPPNVQHQTPPSRPTRDNQGRWIVNLSGSASDASGTASTAVLLQGSQDLYGQGWQTADFSGSSWSLAYVLPPFGVNNQSQNDPSGSYGLFLRAADSVGNETQNPAQADTIILDAAAPLPTLTEPLTTTTLITTALTLRGDIVDNSSVSGVEINLTPAEQIDGLGGNVLHLPLDENQATEYFADQSGSNHAATCSASACPAVNQPGRRDAAVAFDGQDDILSIEAGELLNFATDQDFAVTFWLAAGSQQADQSVANNSIIGKGSGAILPFAVRYHNQTGQVVALRSDGSNSPGLTSTTAVNDGQFHHIAFVKSGGTLSFYIDGVLETTTADTTTGTTTNNSAVYVGAKGDGTAHFTGSLDEITIYNRALVDYEVSDLYDYGFGTWETAALNNNEWTYTLPEDQNGLEGIFQLNVRGTDAAGNVTPLSGQNLWRGEIDTRPPSLTFSATVDNTGSSTTTTFSCTSSDLNLDQDASCLPVPPDAVPTFRSSDMTLTTYDQVNPWYAATITDTTRLYTIDATRIYSGTQDTSGSLQACDAFNRCTTGLASAAALTAAREAAAAAGDPAAEILDPSSGTVLLALDPLTISGHAFASASLQELTVTVDGAGVHTQSWASGAATDTPWNFSWTPPAEGKYLFDTQVTDWNGLSAMSQQTTTIWVDTTPPTVTISPTLLSQADLIGETIVNLSGSAADGASVERVEVSIDGGPWQRAGLDPSGSWHYPWDLGAPVDGQSYNVSARATDHAGRATTATASILVDTIAPEPGDVVLTALNSGGQEGPLVSGVTYSNLETLRLQFAAAADGSGIARYEAGFTAERFEDPANLTPYTAPATHQQPAGEAAVYYAHLIVVDSAGNRGERTTGPFYVDASLTPDLVSLIDYHGWTDNTCTVQGIDRRLAHRHPGTQGDALQQFFVSWDAANLRLSWQGAHWEAGGDLFVYLDTRPGGADRLFNPFADDDMVIYLPGHTPDPQTAAASGSGAAVDALAANRPAMQADIMVWVENAGQATIWRWDAGGWQNMGALSGDHFRFSGGVDNGHTDLLLSFADLGILDPASASLGLLAVASDEDALRLWATMPALNPLSSAQVVNPIAGIAADYTYALSRAYYWDGLGTGQCANGRLNADGSSPAGGAFADSDLHLTLTAGPVGTTFSFLENDLAPVWSLIFGYRPVPISPTALLDFMDTDHPLLGVGDTVNYTLRYENRGSETATGVEVDLSSTASLQLPQQSLNLGDIAPGASGTIQFSAEVVASAVNQAAYEDCLLHFPAELCNARRALAQVTALVYDDANPRQSGQGLWSSAPLEWLFSEHFVDIDGPKTTSITSPEHVVRGGEVMLRGTVHDHSAVPEIALEWRVNGGALNAHSCSQATPNNNTWRCTWSPGTVNDGDMIEIRVRGIDIFGQEGTWSEWKTLTVDKTRPEVTVDPGVDGYTFGEGLHILSGTASDDHGVSRLQICVEGKRCVTRDVQSDGAWSTYLPQIDHGNPDGLEHIVHVYAFDNAGNRSDAPVTVTYWLDTTPPQLAVTRILEVVGAGTTQPVLEGTASDGSAFDVFVLLITPQGQKQRFKANAKDGTWAFYHQFTVEGSYLVRVQAIDIAGNSRTIGTYSIQYTGGPQVEQLYFPVLAIRN